MNFTVTAVTYVENEKNKILFGTKSTSSYYVVQLYSEAFGTAQIKISTLQDARKYKIGSSYEAKLTEIL